MYKWITISCCINSTILNPALCTLCIIALLWAVTVFKWKEQLDLYILCYFSVLLFYIFSHPLVLYIYIIIKYLCLPLFSFVILCFSCQCKSNNQIKCLICSLIWPDKLILSLKLLLLVAIWNRLLLECIAVIYLLFVSRFKQTKKINS